MKAIVRRHFASAFQLVAPLAALCALGTASTGQASTLSPGHPVWSQAGIDRESFLRHWERSNAERPKGRGALAAEAPAKAARFGARVLVVPTLFAESGAPAVSREQLQASFFGDEPSSFRSYWSTVSRGRFVPEGLVVPWVRVPEGLSFYRNVLDGRATTNDAGIERLVRDALRGAAAVVDDLSQFDDDGPDGVPGSGDDDGRIDLLLVLHPEIGFEVEPVATGPAILAQQGTVELDPELVAVSGVAADAYVVASARGPLGVWVHEAGHLLGLEDLYDLDVGEPPGTVASRGGLGLWSLMASGTWGDAGRRPSHLDAINRQLLGWDEITVLEDARSMTLDPVTADRTQSTILLPLGDWAGERFVLENRQRREGSVVDGALPGSGVLVYRVDDSLRENRASTGFWIELMQADGQDDLGARRNEGDAGDPFPGSSGALRFGPLTDPSSASRTGDPSRIAPVLEFGPSGADDSRRVDFALAADGALRLERAFFEDALRGDRTHLLPDETGSWRVQWSEVGESAVGSASIRLLSVGASLEIESSSSLPLTPVGAGWETETPVTVRALATDPAGFAVAVGLSVDGGPERTVQLGIPVGLGPGLRENALFDFEPVVLSAASDTTVFAVLSLSELPLSADDGWGLRTQGMPVYANEVDVALEGPWFAVPAEQRVRLWSRGRTEGSLPGQVFDAGVLEAFRPDRGWRPLEPDEGSTVHVVQRSRANLRGRIGFGGPHGEWQRAGAPLPGDLVAQRVRLRFASDRSVVDEGWSVAGLNTVTMPARATVTVEEELDGDLVATAILSGDLSSFITLRYRWRRPLDAEWQTASPLLGLRGGAITRTAIAVPASEAIVRIGLFAEIASGGSASPRLLLGETGLRRRAELALPALLTNPARGTVLLQMPAQSSETRLRIHDLRGRRVRDLVVPAGVAWFEWDGSDEGGTKVAAGRYFIALADEPSRVVSLTYFP